VSASDDGALILWKTSTAEILHIFERKEQGDGDEAHCCSFSPHGDSVVGGYGNGEITVWNLT
jgi:WD40 repeat protein